MEWRRADQLVVLLGRWWYCYFCCCCMCCCLASSSLVSSSWSASSGRFAHRPRVASSLCPSRACFNCSYCFHAGLLLPPTAHAQVRILHTTNLTPSFLAKSTTVRSSRCSTRRNSDSRSQATRIFAQFQRCGELCTDD